MTDLEEFLRTELRAAADEGPVFVAPDLSEAPTPEARGRRWPALVAAAVVVVGGGTLWATLAQRDTGSGSGQASCAYLVQWAGQRWSTTGSDRRPVAGAVLGTGVVPGCDDGNGAAPDETVEVRAVRGVDPAAAIVVDGELLVPWGARVPDELADAGDPVRCAVEGTVRLAGRWEGVTSRRQPRVDGDVRPPYRIAFRTADPRVTDGYAEVLLHARATAASRPLSPAEVRSMLGHDGREVLTTHCDAGRFVVESLDPAE